MTVEEIIEKLNSSKRNTPLEINSDVSNQVNIEYTLTNEYIVNYFDHHHMIKSEVYPNEAGFVLFLREFLDKHKH